jgi:hypothetical protein
MSATSRMQGKHGGIYHDLEVPDFSDAPLSLSGVAISTAPPVVSGPPDLLAGLIPVVPTTVREFHGHRAEAFLRIYQGGRAPVVPVRLSIRIRDLENAVVAARDEDLGADRFGTNRSADYLYELPIPRLKPGQYVLTFEATTAGAASVRQDVRFTVGEPWPVPRGR